MEKKTFKLIDIEGYLESCDRNASILSEFFTQGKVIVHLEDHCGWIGNNCIINGSEWEFFKEVEDTSHTSTEEVKAKRKVELTEKIFLAMMSNSGLDPEHKGEEILEAAIEYASKFIEKLEGGDK